MEKHPNGTVTLLFTDIEGSTKLAQEHPVEIPALFARHHEILKHAVRSHNGYIFQIVGDAFCVAFHSANDAINAALDAQRDLQNEAWFPAPIKVRMGIHSGTVQAKEDGQYSGYTTLASAQRIMSAGHGGQILLSGATRELVRNSPPENAELKDLGEKRLKDLLRSEHLYQLNASGSPSDFPALNTLDTYLNNLPTQLTSFIGREHEIDELSKLILKHRVVTITGPGGAGKTRLSLQVGAQSLERFTNGVWFVELAALTDPSLIISAVMSAMSVREKDNDINTLAHHIGNQSLLLILDNCEHLIEDCARLAESLVKGCPNLHMLASSREALCIAGEQPYQLPSLPFPDPKEMPSLDEIANCEAVQLFVERVKTYDPSFMLTDKNASPVAQICSRLDGIPLALELAAARVKVMSVEQMALRLGDIFNLLTSGSRTALPRQQTLRALIEWSYDLLSDSEKNLFRKLAAFSGGWSLEAAEAVCSQERGAPVLDDLARLVDKSLVVKEEIDGEARFHMLETIRQYAEFKLFAAEEVEDVKDRHRDWFMRLAETAEPKLRTGEQLPWLNRIEMEHDNLRSAIRWSLEQKDIEEALRIPSALAYFWEIHAHGDEGRNWLTQALALEAQGNERKYPYAWATAVDGHFGLSAFLPNIGQYLPRMEEALDIFRQRGDASKAGRVLYHLAYIPHLEINDLEGAKSKYQAGYDSYQIADDKWGMGECLHCLAHVEEQQGNTARAHVLYNESLEALNVVGDRFRLFHPLGDTAIIALEKGELQTAKKLLEESIQVFTELKNRRWVCNSTDRLAQVLIEQGEYETARTTILRNLEVVNELNDLNGRSWNTYLLGKIDLAEGNLSAARGHFNQALRYDDISFISDKAGGDFYAGWVLAGIGLIDCLEGDIAQGKERIELGIEKIRKEYAPNAAHILPYRSLAFWLEKDPTSAARSYRESIGELQRNFYFIRIPECLEGLGKIAVTQNDFERAARLFGAAEGIRHKMGTPIPSIQRGEYDAYIQNVREKLGGEFDMLCGEGRTMMLEQAVEFSLEGNS